MIIYGMHAIKHAIKKNRLTQLYVSQDALKKYASLLKLAKEKSLPVQTLQTSELEQLAGSQKHQGLAASLKHENNQITSFDDAIAQWSQKDNITILILDEVTDPHNLGACIRTAEAAGCAAVITPKNRSAPLNATVAKTSSGAISHIPVFNVTNLVRTIEQLQKTGFWMYGFSDQANQSLYSTVFSSKTALIMGSEGKGMRPSIARACDHLAAIPMAGMIESLNVSVATGVALYERVRQQQKN